MTARLIAIGFIYFCTTLAWVVLGGTLLARTGERTARLRDQVASTWGSPHQQSPPTLEWRTSPPVPPVESAPPRSSGTSASPAPAAVAACDSLEPVRTRVDARVALEPRRKGLLWYSTYGVEVTAEHTFRNTTGKEREFRYRLPLPARQATYDDLWIRRDGQALEHTSDGRVALASLVLPAGASTTVRTHYRSRGLDRWEYALGSGVAQVNDFALRLRTNFDRVDFPENTLSPTSRRRDGSGWDLRWDYRHLLSGVPIALAMPERRQPGPLAARVCMFAPVSLLFFFFVLWLITTLRGIELHPVNYFFLAAAFFAFHLLIAYTADLVPLELSFALASVVSVALVVSYLRLVVGSRFAWLEAGLAQFVYLVLFSYSFFIEGLTGLTVTIGAVLTLFVAMQLTARVRWSEKFAAPSGARLATPR